MSPNVIMANTICGAVAGIIEGVIALPVQNETNFVKTKWEGPRKLLLNTVNFF
jgi:hypothetical protein